MTGDVMKNMMTKILASRVGLLGFVVSALLGCGGGGGSSGATKYPGSTESIPATSAAASLAITLLDSNNNVLNPPLVTGSTQFKVKVLAKGADGAVVQNVIVAVSSADITFDPVGGSKLTVSDGTATFGAKQTVPTATSATLICATATIATVKVDKCVPLQMGAVSASLGAISIAQSTVAAYQTTQVGVPVVYSVGAPAIGVPVAFSASCGQVSPATSTSDSVGVATVSYANNTGNGGSCSGTVTITASTQGSAVSGTLSALAPVAANIQFLSASPERIYLKGSPSVSTSLVTFKLLDASGNPVAGRNIKLELSLYPTGTYLGSTAGTITLTQTTDAIGQVTASVNAGTAPGPVQLKSTLLDLSNVPTSTVNVSNSLSVASGLPTQKAFSLSVETFNMEAWDTDGVKTAITIRAADRLGNPVPDGTSISFVSEGGQIVGSCLTTGASINGTAACSVDLSSQNFRPVDGRVTVLAWAQGEESFVDNSTPSNNVYDVGVDSHTELGQPFGDDNFNGVKDAGEPTVGQPSGSAACPGGVFSAPNTCDGVWGAGLVYGTTEVIFSGADPFLTSEVFSNSGGSCSYSFNIKDARGNPMPKDTTIAAVSIKGGKGGAADAMVLGYFGQGDKVPNTNDVNKTNHGVYFQDCTDPTNLTFGLAVTTPSGKKTTFFRKYN